MQVGDDDDGRTGRTDGRTEDDDGRDGRTDGQRTTPTYDGDGRTGRRRTEDDDDGRRRRDAQYTTHTTHKIQHTTQHNTNCRI